MATILIRMIIPARYLVHRSERTGSALYGGCRSTFVAKASPGDIIVAGKISAAAVPGTRPLAIKAAGISCVIAENFARIFYRNAINIGLPILESAEAAAFLKEGQQVEINLEEGKISELSSGRTFTAVPFPPFMQGIMAKGGLINYIREKQNKK